MAKKYNWIEKLKIKDDISEEVKICAERINNSGVWWQVSRNHDDIEARSCKHASKVRNRLGAGANGGIPLWAELKSLVGIVVTVRKNEKILFAAHTRANTEFSDYMILEALGLDAKDTIITRVLDANTIVPGSSDFSKETFNTGSENISKSEFFGKVNPFNVDLILRKSLGIKIKMENICQIFDESLKLHGGFPNTIMSNLGNRKIAFEIHPDDLIKVVESLSLKSIVTKIAAPCPIWLGREGKQRKSYWAHFPPPSGPKIGLLTGNSPESGITLCQDILKSIRKKYTNLADVLMPEIHMHSLPQMGLSMEIVSRDDHVWQEIKKAITVLLEIGCRIITIACNTTIYYESRIIELCEAKNAKFISIAEACMPAINRELEKCDRKSVALVGIGPVIDMESAYSGYKRHLEREGINVTPCSGEEFAFSVKNLGTKSTEKEKSVKQRKGRTFITEFINFISYKIPREENVVVLALTEFSMIYRDYNASENTKEILLKVIIDPLYELGKYIALLYLIQGYIECYVCQIPDDFKIREKLTMDFANLE